MNSKKFEKQIFPCPLCQRGLDIRISKKDKPYCVCSDCGLQLFIRNEEGVSRLEKKLRIDTDFFDLDKSGGKAEKLADLKKRLKKIEHEIEWDWFDEKPGLKTKREDLLREISRIEDKF